MKIEVSQEAYAFLSCVVYSGSGKNGHYICVRHFEGKLYEISDSIVDVLNSLKEANGRLGNKSGSKLIFSLFQKMTITHTIS
jgi:ubiquitin C-terminal hydrolase